MLQLQLKITRNLELNYSNTLEYRQQARMSFDKIAFLDSEFRLDIRPYAPPVLLVHLHDAFSLARGPWMTSIIVLCKHMHLAMIRGIPSQKKIFFSENSFSLCRHPPRPKKMHLRIEEDVSEEKREHAIAFH
jgi:predicted MPP superfamily phosphohydrolase